MKQTIVQIQSRSKILTWINNHVSDQVGKINRFEELGNGSAYLFLLSHLRPGIIRTDKIVKKPVSQHQISSNLRMLAICLQKMSLDIKVDIAKIGEMKYYDNYDFASSIYKKFKDISQGKDQKENNFRQLLTKSIIQKAKHSLKKLELEKQPLPPMTHQQIFQLTQSASKIKEIKTIIDQRQQDTEKLNKIAKLLNLMNVKPYQQEQKSVKAPLNLTPRSKWSLEASYRRHLRPSLCEKSQFLKYNSQFTEVEIENEKIIEKPSCSKQRQQMQQYVDEQLLSQKKQEDTNLQETTVYRCEQNIDLLANQQREDKSQKDNVGQV